MKLPEGYRNVIIAVDDIAAGLAAIVLNSRKPSHYYTETSPETINIVTAEWMLPILDEIVHSIFALEEDTDRHIENAAILLRGVGVFGEHVYELISYITDYICSVIAGFLPDIKFGPSETITAGVCSGGDITILIKE